MKKLLIVWLALLLCSSAQAERETVWFKDTGEVLMNPGMGWVLLEEALYPGRTSLGWLGDFPEANNVSLSMSWANVEVADGVYDWSEMDRTIDYWTGLGKHINMRLATDQNIIGYPIVAVPDWVGDECGVPYVELQDGGYITRSYKLSDPGFLEKHDRFVYAFAERYRDNPMIDVIEIRAYGAFGEWHSSGNFDSLEERVATLRHFIDVWCDAWGDKLMVVSASYELDQRLMPYSLLEESFTRMKDFAYASAFDYAVQKGVAFRRDGIGGAMRNWDTKMIQDTFSANNRKPVLGEHFTGYYEPVNTGTGYTRWEMMYEATYHLHSNYMTALGWVAEPFANMTLPNEQGGAQDVIDFGNRYMGFRFLPHRVSYDAEVAAGGTLKVDSLWSNLAVGRAWRKADLTVSLVNEQGDAVWSGVDGSFDPVVMNAGDVHAYESLFTLPEDLPQGVYTLSIALTDPADGSIMYKLPITGRDDAGRYPVGTVKVNADAPVSPAENLLTAPVCGGIPGEKSRGEVYRLSGLEAGKAYLVSFDYTSDIAPEQVEITSNERYAVTLQRDGREVQGYRWRDVSGEPSHRTVLLAAPGEGTVDLVFALEKQYPMTLTSLYIAPLDGAVIEDFEGESHVIEAVQRPGDALRKKYAVNGEMGMRIYNTQAGTEAVGAVSQALTPGTAYLISFTSQGMGAEYPGAHFFLELTWDGGSERIGTWYERNDLGDVRRMYAFITPAEGESHLSFGGYSKGSYTLDDVVLVPLQSGVVPVTGECPPIARNVNRVPVFEGYPIRIDFEGGSNHAQLLTPGVNHQGRLTVTEGEVIEGKYSAYGFMRDERDGSNNYLRSTPWEIPMSAGNTYVISFSYRVVAPSTGVGRSLFQIFDGAGRLVQEHELTGDTGEVCTFQCVYTPEMEGSILHWVLEKSGAVAVDGICIEETRR